MSGTKIDVTLKPFKFPNFLHVECRANQESDTISISVAELSDEQAETYWDALKHEWLKHVATKRNHWRDK